MAKRQLFALFACNLAGWIVVQGTISLIAVFAVRLGADSAWAGNILALSFAGLLVGTLATGWLSGRFQRRRLLLIVAGAANVPVTFLMGQATDYMQLALLTTIMFSFVGVSFTTINILAGLFAREGERGMVFGLLAINNPLGLLIGGAISGPIADRAGYPALFAVGACVWILQPLIVAFIADKRVEQPAPDAAVAAASPLGVTFYLFLLGGIMAFAATFFGVLGRPLVMDGLKFDAAAISGTGALAGAVTMPLPFAMGWLSDRVGRLWLIVLCYAVGALGLVALASSSELWHFRAATVMLASIGVSIGVTSAFIIDLVPAEKIGRALAVYGFAGPIGGIVGFGITGNLIQNLGAPQTFIGGALLTVAAIVLIVAVRPARKQLAYGAPGAIR